MGRGAAWRRDTYKGLMPNKLLTLLILSTQFLFPQSSNGEDVVRAVLFYSPTCGHCQLVIRETILPLTEQYGEQFQVVGVDTTQPQGQALYESARDYFNLEFRGVPFLVIGNEYLSGSVEIPQKLAGTIEKYMAQGGVDWPAIPGLQEAIYASLTAQAPTSTPPLQTSTAASPSRTPAPVILEPADSPNAPSFTQIETSATVWQKIMFDPVGNGLAVIVLFIMVGILIFATLTFKTFPAVLPPTSKRVLIPILCILGIGIAAYLAFVEITQTTAVCGPVGDCNTVQQSEYARLFGILPIGLIGAAGYLVILTSWELGRGQKGSMVKVSKLTTFGLSAIGFVFSIYLTFLEPFVIGATCAWCLSSAVILTILFILTLSDTRRIIPESSR